MRDAHTAPVLYRINTVSRFCVLLFEGHVVFKQVLDVTRVIPYFFREVRCRIPFVLMGDRV